jgi:hypothetical protein
MLNPFGWDRAGELSQTAPQASGSPLFVMAKAIPEFGDVRAVAGERMAGLSCLSGAPIWCNENGCAASATASNSA